MDFKGNKFNILLLAAYFFIAVLLMMNHEIWRDEAQVWCLVRDLNLVEIFQAARIEGHPMLWYLILMPFAKLGMGVMSMQVVSFIFVFLAAVYFVFKSPFNLFLKLLVLFSAGFLYYLPVVARNYCLIPIFLFLLAGLYEKRKEHPYWYSVLIILLANTHILMLGFSLSLSVVFVFETKKLKPALILGANFILIFLTFYNMQNVNHAVAFYSSHPAPLQVALVNYAAQFNLNAPLFYVLVLLAAFSLLKNKKLLFIFTAAAGYHFFVYYKIWAQGIIYQKAFLLLLVLLFCLWIENKNRLLTLSVGALFALSAILSYFTVVLEFYYPFSGAKETAQFVKNNLEGEKEFIAVGYPFVFTAVSAYLPDKKLYSQDKYSYISYYDFTGLSSKKVVEKPDCTYFIVQNDFKMNDDFEEIFASNPNILSLGEYNEIFKIYKKRKKL